jgi:hypothetical protein
MVALKEGRDEEQQAFLDVPLQDRPDVTAPRSGWPRALAFYLRLALELTMAAAIGFLLVRLSHVSSEPSLMPSPVPQCMSHAAHAKCRISDATSSSKKDIRLQRGQKIFE